MSSLQIRSPSPRGAAAWFGDSMCRPVGIATAFRRVVDGSHASFCSPPAICRDDCKKPTTATRIAGAMLNSPPWVDEIRLQPQRADGPASMLAVGTANPTNCLPQDEAADYYFQVTQSGHLTKLKDKMKSMCARSGINMRYFYLNEDILRDHPQLLDATAATIDAKLDIAASAVPELAAVAAAKAISEWGRPASDITHLIVSTNSGAHMPGADFHLASLLGLSPSVQRTMLYLHGCSAGSSALRVAKDIAENNRAARVLVACADVFSVVGFHGPDEARTLEAIVAPTLFGDGAAAVIVGADPLAAVERPVFEMLSTSQITIPGSDYAATSQFKKGGLTYRLSKDMPALVRVNIEKCLVDALTPLGLKDGCSTWNSLFWAAHPGGRGILDSYEAALRLEPGKLAASRRVLSEYGNMSGATTIFVLDELRRRHQDEGISCEWGVMLGLGPGITVEVMALRACLPPPTGKEN